MRVEQAYNGLADRYDDIFQGDQRVAEENEVVASVVRRVVAPGSRVLDIGCGTGLGYELLNRDYVYLGIDISDRMIYKARLKFPTGKFVRTSDGWSPQMASNLRGHPDAVVSLFGSPSYSEPHKVAATLHAVLPPDGRFVLVPYALGRKSEEDYGTAGETAELWSAVPAAEWVKWLSLYFVVKTHGLTSTPPFTTVDDHRYLIIEGRRDARLSQASRN